MKHKIKEEFKNIDHYQIIKRLAQGGMGEVFLAYDTKCKRHVALKKIKADLKNNKTIKKRFLKEAIIASKLTHPGITPIYDINLENSCYYTMPYIEGETLKEIFQKAKENDHPIGKSIPSLVRIFLNVCEAIAYVHSNNILHRDIKPDNIMIGKYGEVLILDWGIAKYLTDKEKDLKLDINFGSEITQPGKLAGTISYMAPERAMGEKASYLCDIYSLGTILYQILTLCLPFKRKDIKSFRKNIKKEKLIEPYLKAPYRDIPKKLTDICKKCLMFSKSQRYQSVKELIKDLLDFIEGRPDWILSTQLDIAKKNDWAFEENIMLSKHTAISKNIDFAEWITLMISKESFSGNIKLEADISIGKEASGVGFFINVLKHKQTFKVEEGYRLWLTSQNAKTSLYKSNILMYEKKLNLTPDKFYKISLEKKDDIFHFYLDNNLIFSHTSHLPLRGTFIGIGFKDDNFIMQNLKIYSSTYNVMVNCLSIADAFFSKEQYDTAIDEYRKIASSFPGRIEAKEAIFRSGITLLEKAKSQNSKKQKNTYLNLALKEFEKLHSTPSEPLEYLGKSLVYSTQEDSQEEAKCLELSIRKYKNHVLIDIIKEHIIYRMHESSIQNQETAYRIILIALRFIEDIINNQDTKKLLLSLNDHLENIHFITPAADIKNHLIIELAYRLNKWPTLLEILQSEILDNINLQNIILVLIDLGFFSKIKNTLKNLCDFKNIKSFDVLFSKKPLENKISELISNTKKLTLANTKLILFALNQLLEQKKFSDIKNIISSLRKHLINKDDKLVLDTILIKVHLLENQTKDAFKIFSKYKIDYLSSENNPLFFLYGIYLSMIESKEIANVHFAKALDTHHLSYFSLAAHFIISAKTLRKILYFEKKQMLKDLILYYGCIKNTKKTSYFKKELAKLEKISK